MHDPNNQYSCHSTCASQEVQLWDQTPYCWCRRILRSWSWVPLAPVIFPPVAGSPLSLTVGAVHGACTTAAERSDHWWGLQLRVHIVIRALTQVGREYPEFPWLGDPSVNQSPQPGEPIMLPTWEPKSVDQCSQPPEHTFVYLCALEAGSTGYMFSQRHDRNQQQGYYTYFILGFITPFIELTCGQVAT